jgi:glycosyltransferase involved in cell wall biosynthesis
MIQAYAPIFAHSGTARHGQQFFTALRKLIRLTIKTINTSNADESIVESEKDASDSSGLGIGIGPIEFMQNIRTRFRIAFIVWEGTRLPACNLETLKRMDQVWVPSSWGKQVLLDNGLDSTCLHVVPEGVDATMFAPIRKDRRPRSMVYRFLAVGKWEDRKNIDGLVRSFAQEFSYSEPVELILHCFNPFNNFDHERRVLELTGAKHPPIRISKPVGPHLMARVYNRCDAFVLPTRAEGWGLPIIEAMACSLPVITTAYSAPMDYLSSDYAYLLKVRGLVPIKDLRSYGNEAVGVWAEPDHDHLRLLMRHVYENREEAETKGMLASEVVSTSWTWDLAAAKAFKLLCRHGYL